MRCDGVDGLGVVSSPSPLGPARTRAERSGSLPVLLVLLLSLTLYPPSPSVPDRSRPDFMNCKRTVASPSSFAPCTPRAPGSPLKSPLHLAKFALSRSQGHRLLTSPDGNCRRVRGIIPECPPQEWHVCVCLPFSAIQRLVGSN